MSWFHLHERSEGWRRSKKQVSSPVSPSARRTNVLRLNKFGKDHSKTQLPQEAKLKKRTLFSSPLKSFLNIWKVKKCPSRPQCRHFLKILTKKEKITFFVFLLLFAASFFSLLLSLYFKNTEIQPSPGGVFVEGVDRSLVHQPKFINPIYANSDIDRDLVELIFSGLLKYDENLKVVPDLAKNYEIKDDGKVYEVYLKDNLFWSDGKPLTANDVIFTIKTIRSLDYKSPQIASWVGVEIEKISERSIRFSLKNPYDSFLENLTQKIIPEHIWKDIDLAVYNLEPVGSGPYKLKEFKQDKAGRITSLDLVRNQRYFGKTPYLSQISFRFFDSEKELIKAGQRKKIQGILPLDPDNYQYLKTPDFQDFHLFLPRYFAVFFNPDKSKILSDLNVRQALNYGTNKAELIEKVLLGYGKTVDSPVLPEIYGFSPPSKIYNFDLELAKTLLDKAGFIEKEGGSREKTVKKELAFQFKTDLKDGSKGKDVEFLQQCLAKDPEVYPEGRVTGEFGSQTKNAVISFQEKYAKDILVPFGLTKGTGLVSKATRAKLNEICFPPPQETLPLKFSLATVNQPLLIKVADFLKERWKNLGADVEIKIYEESEIKDVIKTRNYDSLLFAEVLGAVPDPFPFWHSLQKKDPGLNLAAYQNKKADKLLEEIRQTNDGTERKEKLEQFQDILIEDAPAVFLYNPGSVYFVSKELKGMNSGIIAEPAKRFANIENWYTKTKRVLK